MIYSFIVWPQVQASSFEVGFLKWSPDLVDSPGAPKRSFANLTKESHSLPNIVRQTISTKAPRKWMDRSGRSAGRMVSCLMQDSHKSSTSNGPRSIFLEPFESLWAILSSRLVERIRKKDRKKGTITIRNWSSLFKDVQEKL